MRGEEGISVKSLTPNSDPQKSTQPCGCDEGANYKAPECRKHVMVDGYLYDIKVPFVTVVKQAVVNTTDEKLRRKQHPVYSGVIKYFPLALMEVANISWIGNEQHNPGEPLHWARHKSTDQLDAAVRHIIDHASGKTLDTDGGYHLAKAAWRILAELELVKEKA